jgi:hypothetical protein
MFNWPGREISLSFSMICDLRSDGVSPHEFVGLNVIAPTVGMFVVGPGEDIEGL